MVPFHSRLSVEVITPASKEKQSIRKPILEQYVHGTPRQRFSFRKDIAQMLAVVTSLEEIECDFHLHFRVFNTHYVDLGGTIYVWSENLVPVAEKAIAEIERIARRASKHCKESSAVMTHAVYPELRYAA